MFIFDITISKTDLYTMGLFKNSHVFEIEYIWLELFEIELFQLEYLTNWQFGKTHNMSNSIEKSNLWYNNYIVKLAI